MVRAKRDLLQLNASMRARRRGEIRGEIPSECNPSPAQPCTCLLSQQVLEGASTGAFTTAEKYQIKLVTPIDARMGSGWLGKHNAHSVTANWEHTLAAGTGTTHNNCAIYGGKGKGQRT